MQFVPFILLAFRLVLGEETGSRLYECAFAGMGHTRASTTGSDNSLGKRQCVSGGLSRGIFNREIGDHEIQSSCGFLEQNRIDAPQSFWRLEDDKRFN